MENLPKIDEVLQTESTTLSDFFSATSTADKPCKKLLIFQIAVCMFFLIFLIFLRIFFGNIFMVLSSWLAEKLGSLPLSF